MESIEQPIFNPYGSDDKDDLITDPPSHRPASSSPTSNHENESPVHAAKSLLSAGKQAMSNQNRGLWIIIISTIVFAVIVTIALILTIYLLPRQVSGHAAVVTEVGECSVVGLEVLKKGGNAVDAAVAAAFCLGVIHPQSSGIGGGGFLLFHDHKNDHSSAYNFRETAPAAAKPDMFSGIQDKEMSGLSVAVPGELKGLAEVHSELGRLDWSTLIQPAIDMARNGFNVTKNLAASLHHHLDVESVVGGKSNALVQMYTVEGVFVRAGDFVRRPDLAATLELIRDQGSAAFYGGQLGQRFVTMVRDAGGVMTVGDLESYTVLKTQPVVSTFKDHTVLGVPAPSSGPVVSLMLNMLEGFNWTSQSASQAPTYQSMIETFKFGFAHRGLLGDPANLQYREDIHNATTILLSESYATSLREKVDNTSHDNSYYGPTIAPPPNLGTTHISVIDSSELMVSLTLTVNQWFGSKLMMSDGILANNEMLDFSSPDTDAAGLPPNMRNQIVPGMRPLSSMVPTIVYNKDRPCATRVVTGASNGTRIITGVVETLVNSFLFNMDLKTAVASPRIHQQLYPNANTEYERLMSSAAPNSSDVFPQRLVEALSAQTMVPVSEGLSCVNAIAKFNDDVHAYADWRKGGHAATY